MKKIVIIAIFLCLSPIVFAKHNAKNSMTTIRFRLYEMVSSEKKSTYKPATGICVIAGSKKGPIAYAMIGFVVMQIPKKYLTATSTLICFPDKYDTARCSMMVLKLKEVQKRGGACYYRTCFYEKGTGYSKKAPACMQLNS